MWLDTSFFTSWWFNVFIYLSQVHCFWGTIEWGICLLSYVLLCWKVLFWVIIQLFQLIDFFNDEEKLSFRKFFHLIWIWLFECDKVNILWIHNLDWNGYKLLNDFLLNAIRIFRLPNGKYQNYKNYSSWLILFLS